MTSSNSPEARGFVPPDVSRSALLGVINQMHAVDPNTGRFNVDAVWSNPSTSNPFTRHLADYVRATVPMQEVSAVVGAIEMRHDNVYGLVPLIPSISIELQRSFGIWKELGDPITGMSVYTGAEVKNGALLIQDRIDQDSITTIRALLDLREKGVKPYGLVGIVVEEPQSTLPEIQKYYAKYTGESLTLTTAVFTPDDLSVTES